MINEMSLSLSLSLSPSLYTVRIPYYDRSNGLTISCPSFRSLFAAPFPRWTRAIPEVGQPWHCHGYGMVSSNLEGTTPDVGWFLLISWRFSGARARYQASSMLHEVSARDRQETQADSWCESQPLGTRDRRDASIKGLNSNNWTSPGAAKAIDGKHLEPLDGQTHTHMYAYREERERERDR